MYKLTALIIAVYFFTAPGFTQNATISGTVKDTIKQKGVQNAVIALLTPKDSILYKFTRSDASGNYTFKNIK